MTWTHKKPGDANGFSKLGELTVRIMRLAAHAQLSRAEAQLRAQKIPVDLVKPFIQSTQSLPKKELVQEFSCLTIKETKADF